MEIKTCCLCGKKLGKRVSRDHVPLKQFYAKAFRDSQRLNLFWLPTHEHCNKCYQHDEDYFVASFGGEVTDSPSGRRLWEDQKRRFRRPEGQRLLRKIMNEFDDRPGGIYLPAGMLVRNVDGDRISRVIWKITRGLFLKEAQRVLPEGTDRLIRFSTPREETPEFFQLVRGAGSRGDYPGVFDYKFRELVNPLSTSVNLHAWGMLFWDRIIAMALFHDPECPCEICSGCKES